MNDPALSSTITAIQTATSPVILISGVGLLLLTMTNRLGRAIDRARALSSGDGDPSPEVKDQIRVLLARARILRSAILCAVTGALSAGLLVILIFGMSVWGRNLSGLVSALFIFCMAAIIASLAFFMRDVNLSLAALKRKLKRS